MYEFRLRFAQAHDALRNIRSHLCQRSQLFIFKDRNVRGQRGNTRSCDIIKNVQEKIDADSLQYHVAYDALTCLGPVVQQNEWANELRPLRTADIRASSEGELGESQGKITLSWIWLTPGVGTDVNANMQEGRTI